MSQAVALNANSRKDSGTGAARKIRNEGNVPAILYGGNKEPVNLIIAEKNIHAEVYTAGFFSKVFDLNIDNKENTLVIAKAVQTHPVDSSILHVDFQRVDKNSKINVYVPVNYINEDKSPGLKLGGVLNIIIHKLELTCPVNGIPDSINIDLTGMIMNHSIHIDSVKLPHGVVPAHANRDYTLATIVSTGANAEEEKAK